MQICSEVGSISDLQPAALSRVTGPPAMDIHEHKSYRRSSSLPGSGLTEAFGQLPVLVWQDVPVPVERGSY